MNERRGLILDANFSCGRYLEGACDNFLRSTSKAQDFILQTFAFRTRSGTFPSFQQNVDLMLLSGFRCWISLPA